MTQDTKDTKDTEDAWCEILHLTHEAACESSKLVGYIHSLSLVLDELYTLKGDEHGTSPLPKVSAHLKSWADDLKSGALTEDNYEDEDKKLIAYMTRKAATASSDVRYLYDLASILEELGPVYGEESFPAHDLHFQLHITANYLEAWADG